MISDVGLPPIDPHYTMTLFVAGATRLSLLAVANVQQFCEEELIGHYNLEVVDLYQTPERAKTSQVLAAPTLLRHSPSPARRVIGDMSDRNRLRAAVKVA